jgi:hypothetical protein
MRPSLRLLLVVFTLLLVRQGLLLCADALNHRLCCGLVSSRQAWEAHSTICAVNGACSTTSSSSRCFRRPAYDGTLGLPSRSFCCCSWC